MKTILMNKIINPRNSLQINLHTILINVATQFPKDTLLGRAKYIKIKNIFRVKPRKFQQ